MKTADPMLAEVRAARAAISAECGHDLHRLLARQRRFMKRWQRMLQKARKPKTTPNARRQSRQVKEAEG